MTVETNTPDPAAENATLRTTLAALQTDNARLLSEAQTVAKTATDNATALAAALRERDTFKQQAIELEPRAKQADELKLQVEGYVNAGRETALVEALRAKLPSAEPLVIRGMLTTLHDAKRINKFAEDHTAELAKVLPIITAEAQSLTRPPTSGGGSSGVRPDPAKPAGYRGPFSKKK